MDSPVMKKKKLKKISAPREGEGQANTKTTHRLEKKGKKRSRNVDGENSNLTPIQKKRKVVDRFAELDVMEKKALDEEVAQFEGKKKKKKNFERARETFERIQGEREVERETKREERRKRGEAIQRYQEGKKIMQQALKKTNRKGQPNLNAQVSVLLEKIQKQMGK